MTRRGTFGVVLLLACLVISGCDSVSKSAPESAAPAPSTAPAPAPTEAPPTAEPTPDVAPPSASSRDIAVPVATRTAAGLVAELAPTKTSQFSLVGVTWDKTADDDHVTVEVRVRRADGWSAWEPLEVDHDGGEAGRGGTEPWWVDDADEVSARVTTASGASPSGVRVVTVDPGEDPPESVTSAAFYSRTSTSAVVAAADGRPAFTPAPHIISRAAWGARASAGCGTGGYSAYGASTEGVVLHHTAGSNSYSKAKSASIVRATQSFHMSGRGWCDIAYNFLVDQYGQIFEGRAGGIDRAVRGSHAGNGTVNELTMGVSLMGNLDKKKPSTKMKNATVKLVGWRMGTYYLPARGKISLGGKTLNRISGHRNVVGTACPGKYGYKWLNAKGGLRDRVASYVAGYSTPIKWAAGGIPPVVRGVVVSGEFGDSQWRHMVYSNLDLYWRSELGVFAVEGPLRDALNFYGGPFGPLGFPIGGLAASDGVLRKQPFQGGAMWRTDANVVYGLWGQIFTTYGLNPGLGRPTSGIVPSAPGQTMATFANGTITQNGNDAPVVHMTAALAQEAPSELVPEPTTPTPSPSEEGVAPTSWGTSDLWFLRSGMISA